MRRVWLIGALALAILAGTGCTRVQAGYVGLLSTYAGSGRGMSGVSVGPAWVPYNPFTESVFEYPTFSHTVQWTHDKSEGNPVNEEITFSTADSMQVAADVSLSYHIEADRAAAFYLKFRSDDLGIFTMGFMRNVTRDKFNELGGKYKVDTIMGDNGDFIATVRRAVQAELTPIGVVLDQFGIIGIPRPPQQVIDSINAKVKATQLAIQKQNELVQAQADAAKTVAEAQGEAESILAKAKAQAEANGKLSNSLTPAFVEYQKILKWNGELPQVSGGGSGIIVDLRHAAAATQ